MMKYGAHPLTDRFFDTWPLGQQDLEMVSSPFERLSVIYADDPGPMITGYLAQASSGDIAAMVAAVPCMSAAYYLSLVQASTTGAAAHLNFSQFPRNVQDSVRLAEHTIYGSSRIGVQCYGAGS